MSISSTISVLWESIFLHNFTCPSARLGQGARLYAKQVFNTKGVFNCLAPILGCAPAKNFSRRLMGIHSLVGSIQSSVGKGFLG